MKIKVFADTICGWCYIGHSRLNKALDEFKDVQFEIEHLDHRPELLCSHFFQIRLLLR